MILSETEVRQLTGKVKRAKQLEVLRAMGIPITMVRPDGSLVVLRRHIDATEKEGPAPTPKRVLPPRRLLLSKGR